MRTFVYGLIVSAFVTAAHAAQPVIEPGAGWSGVTGIPAAVGDAADPYGDARCIVRWGVVPFRTFDDSILVSVVAFHGNGIDRVEFAVNGGSWVAVMEPIAEYWDGFTTGGLATAAVAGGGEYVAKLRAADFAGDVTAEVRARIYPNTAGLCRVLPDTMAIVDNEEALVLYPNAGGTWTGGTRYVDSENGDDAVGDGTAGNPFATLEQAVEDLHGDGELDGATVLLQEGSYRVVSGSVPTTYNDVPVVIKAAPGASQAGVRIDQQSERDGWLIEKFSLQDLSIPLDSTSGNFIWGLHPNNQREYQLGWWHNCILSGPGADICTTQAGFTSSYVNRQIFTQTEVTGVNSRKTTDKWLIRDCYIHDCSDDVLNKGELVYNTRIESHLQVCGQHSDIWQYYGGLVDNAVYFNIGIRDVTAQIWFPGATIDGIVHNVAMVNVLGAQHIGDSGTSRQHEKDHVLFWHLSWTTQTMLFSTEADQGKNGQIRGCYFRGVGIEGTFEQAAVETVVDIRDNAFNDGATVWGTNGAAGDPLFAAYDDYDFHPLDGSVLIDRVPVRLVAVDLDNNPRDTVTAAGCYAGPYEEGTVNIQHSTFNFQRSRDLPGIVNPAGCTVLDELMGNGYRVFTADGYELRPGQAVDAGVVVVTDGVRSTTVIVVP